VLLGDPPFDWHRERDRLPDALDRRDSHFAEVVEIEVLRRGRRALLLAGGGHLARLSDVSGGNVLQRLERRHPACCFVVLTHYVFDDVVERRKRDVSDLERRLVHWPVPSMASIHGTWLGDVDAKLILGDTARRIEPDGTVFEITVPFLDAAGREVEPVRLADVADAYLYFGPTASLTLARPRPADLRTWEQWRASL
jgi:hypothetical protein